MKNVISIFALLLVSVFSYGEMLFLGYAVNNSAGGANNPAVALNGDSYCNASSAQCWGVNSVVHDAGSLTGVVMHGMEIDVQTNNTADTGAGLNVVPFMNAQPLGNFPAIEINGGIGTFSHGIICDPGAVTNACLQLDAVGLGASKQSSAINFFSTDAGNNARGISLQSSVNGILVVAPAFGANAASLKLPTYTVSTLPSASVAGAGAMATVSDASTFTVGTCTGGGSDYMIAISNGTTWSCH